jgi:hypothetical protein
VPTVLGLRIKLADLIFTEQVKLSEKFLNNWDVRGGEQNKK